MIKVPSPTIAFIGLALAFLTVKDLQEVAGIRLVSLAIPILLVALYADRLRDFVIPRLGLIYMISGALSCP